jgi:Na+/proline symporter
MDWALSVLIIIANLLVSKKNKYGWLVMAITNVLWILYALIILTPPQFGLLPAIVINLVISISGFRSWSTPENKENTKC